MDETPFIPHSQDDPSRRLVRQEIHARAGTPGCIDHGHVLCAHYYSSQPYSAPFEQRIDTVMAQSLHSLACVPQDSRLKIT